MTQRPRNFMPRSLDGVVPTPETLLGLPGAGGRRRWDAIRHGLPASSVAAFGEATGWPARRVAAALGASARTLARRRVAGRLTPTESDRLYRAARVFLRAVETLGSVEKARIWMARPRRAFSGEAPFALLDTDVGARQVEEVLARIDYGVFG